MSDLVHQFQIRKADASQLYINRPLTNLLPAFIQDDEAFVSHKVFPIVRSEDPTGTIWTIPKGTFSRDEVRARAPLAKARKVEWAPAQDTYRTEFYSLGTDIPDQLRAVSQNPFNLDKIGTRQLTRMHQIRRERHFASTFMQTGVWGIDVAGVAAGPTGTQFLQWNNTASTPLKDVTAWATRMQLASEGVRPTGLLLGRRVWDALKNHPEILDRVNRGQTAGAAEVRKADVAALMELDEITVADASYNTANEGQTAAFSQIVGDVALLYNAQRNPELMTPTAGVTIVWTGMLGGAANGWGFRVRQYRMPDVLGDTIEVDQAFDMKKVSADLGVFANTVVAAA
jgi:hypothetical protein